MENEAQLIGLRSVVRGSVGSAPAFLRLARRTPTVVARGRVERVTRARVQEAYFGLCI